ncbi:MAG: MFS transporter [Prevotella sp.]|nr:MFS transporter [Prevotella sp.]MBR0275540.1 MFS transporter [Prevotella sp.]
MNLKVRLSIMNFLEFAVWGAYLTCMGRYLANIGFGSEIGWFYSVQGFVSIFMPAVIGIIADRWIQAQRLLGICHLLAGVFMMAAAWYGYTNGNESQFAPLFILYSCSVAFFMPTIALANSVAFNGLTQAGMDTVKDFPPIRVFGTIGFIVMMLFVDLMGFQDNQNQFLASGVLSVILFAYTFTLPACPTNKGGEKKSLSEALGLRAFSLFKYKEMALFFIFSMLLGVCLQISNGYANPYINSFGELPQYADTFGVQHTNILISLSQVSETLCILLIPFFMKRFGIKKVMLIAMFAWVFRFGFLGIGNPGSGVWLFVLSMIVYGVAFDFFNISGALFVDTRTDDSIRSSAQGLFMLMTNGVGASLGMLAAQAIINNVNDWQTSWLIFAGYALTIGISFALLFKPEKKD